MDNTLSAMEAVSFEEKRVPSNLKECKTLDPVSIWLERWAKIATLCSLGVAALIIVIGIGAWGEEEEFMAFLPFAICSVIVIAVGDFFSTLIRGLSRIVYNTSITANVALMTGAQKENNKATPPEAVATNNVSQQSGFESAPVKAEQNPITYNLAPVIPIPAGDDKIICPICGKEQLSTRKVCWCCNRRFTDPMSTAPIANTRWFCSYCGTENSTNVSQCKKCGKYRSGI